MVIDGYEYPPEDLPRVQVEYMEDTDMLQVHLGDTSGEAETIGRGMYIYRDANEEVVGFCLMPASGILKPMLDALQIT